MTKQKAPKAVKSEGGRPCRLPDVRDELLKLVKAGVSYRIAAEEVGISVRTLLNWITRGEQAAALDAEGYELDDTQQMFLRFLHDFRKARNRLQFVLEARLRELAPSMVPKDTLACLERLDRDRWAQRIDVAHSGSISIDPHELYGESVAKALRQILSDLALTDEQAAAVPGLIDKHFGSLVMQDA